METAILEALELLKMLPVHTIIGLSIYFMYKIISSSIVGYFIIKVIALILSKLPNVGVRRIKCE